MSESMPEDISISFFVKEIIEKMNPKIYFPLAIVICLGAAAFYLFTTNSANNNKRKASSVDIDETLATNTISLNDINYIASNLNPNSTHLDVLLTVASCPDAVKYGLKQYEATQKIIKDRIARDQEEELKNSKNSSKAASNSNMFDLDDDGWADDDDEEMDEEAKQKAILAKLADEQKKKEKEQVDKAMGKIKLLLEGIDEGVVGQNWVENTLAEKGAWPPQDLRLLNDAEFEYNKKKVAPLDHPGLRRNLCMITGRLNSMMLNTHPELLAAGEKKLIDQTYFKGSMEFRQRCSMLLEGALRTAVALRSHELTKTVVETVALFKIGCPPPGDVEWFDKFTMKQYNCLPRLEVENTSIECQGETNMATEDILTLSLEVSRLHAEDFTKTKIAMFQKQGIPPQLALQTYREGWWFLIKAECLSGDVEASSLDLNLGGLLKDVDTNDIVEFKKASFKERLVSAWPMIVQNITQKTGKVKIQFPAPKEAGKYRFSVSILSQDFLGADKEFSLEGTVLDASSVVRKPKEELNGEAESPEETKKEK